METHILLIKAVMKNFELFIYGDTHITNSFCKYVLKIVTPLPIWRIALFE